jgi:hypothetical protein
MGFSNRCTSLDAYVPLIKFLLPSRTFLSWMVIFLKDDDPHVDLDIGYALVMRVFSCAGTKFGAQIPL